MTATQLAYGKRVVWRGLRAVIIDIYWRVDRTQVQIRVVGGHLHWARPEELESQ